MVFWIYLQAFWAHLRGTRKDLGPLRGVLSPLGGGGVGTGFEPIFWGPELDLGPFWPYCTMFGNVYRHILGLVSGLLYIFSLFGLI